jgi:hypothetical protein
MSNSFGLNRPSWGQVSINIYKYLAWWQNKKKFVSGGVYILFHFNTKKYRLALTLVRRLVAGLQSQGRTCDPQEYFKLLVAIQQQKISKQVKSSINSKFHPNSFCINKNTKCINQQQ